MADNQGGETETVDRLLDSTLDSVDSAEELALGIAERAGLAEEDLQKIGMAVRESVVNAVVHGNRYNSHKKIRVTVSQGEGRLTVKIADEGEGFDYENVPNPLAPENLLRNSGRGIFLIRAFMDEFQIRRLTPLGTEVTLIKYLNSK
jgi:serine/threonine-protein kinase RsbW